MGPRGVPEERRHTQSFQTEVMEWADDVSSSVHDSEDFSLAGSLPLALLTRSAEARERMAAQLVVRRQARGKLATGPSEDPARYTGADLAAAFEQLFTEPEGPFEGFRTLSGDFDGSVASRQALRTIPRRLIDRLVRSVEVRDASAPTRRHANDLVIPRDARLMNDVLRGLLWSFVIEHPRMATYQHGQRDRRPPRAGGPRNRRAAQIVTPLRGWRPPRRAGGCRPP